MTDPLVPVQTDAPPAEIPPVLTWAVWVIEKVGVPTAVMLYLLLGLGPKVDRLADVIEQRLPLQTPAAAKP